VTADDLGQLEDLGDGQHRPLGCLLIARPANPARISRQQVVFLNGRHEDRSQQPVGLGSDRY
jgi:hypothetical protein